MSCRQTRTPGNPNVRPPWSRPKPGSTPRRRRTANLSRLSRTITYDNAPPADDLPQLGDYQLLEKLGEGGMGAVYKARHVRLDRVVAIKILPQERTRDQAAVARFAREMKAVGQLNHPNIVQAHDAREIDGTTVLVMEYVEGHDLAEVARLAGPLRDRRCLRTGAPSGRRPAARPRTRPGPSRRQAGEFDAGGSESVVSGQWTSSQGTSRTEDSEC